MADRNIDQEIGRARVPLRVLVVHNQYQRRLPSGENAVVNDEVRLLRDAGHEVKGLLPASDDISLRSPAGAVRAASGPIFGSWGRREIEQILRSWRPDVAHVHNLNPLIGVRALDVLHRAEVPIVCTVHNYRLACINGQLYRNGRICTDCIGRSPLPGVAHGCYRGSRLESIPVSLGLAINHERWRRLSRYLALTPFMRDFLINIGVPAASIEIRPTSAPDIGAPRSDPGESLLFIGRLEQSKGVELLLRAVASRTDIKRDLVICGTGPLASLVANAASQDCRIRYLGALSANEVREQIRRCGAVVIPSLWHEGLPRVFVEALAGGRAVIALATSGGLASVTDQSIGWLTNPDAASLAELLASLTSEELRRKGQAARERFCTQYEESRSLEQLISVYRSVMDAAGA